MGDMKIGEGKKYDATQVSAEGLTQEEIAELTKKNKRLIKIFQAYDTDGKAGLSSTEIAAAMDDFIKAAGEDKKITKREFEKMADTFNHWNELSGGREVSGEDLKNFMKAIRKGTKRDKKVSTQELLDEQQRKADAMLRQMQEARRQEELAAQAEAQARAESEARARQEAETKAETARLQDLQTPKTYTVQEGERFDDLIKRSLVAQGIENPTDEQMQEAIAKFKEDNPNAVHKNRKGVEYLYAGAEVKIAGNLEDKGNSEEIIASIRERNASARHVIKKEPVKPNSEDSSVQQAAKAAGYETTFNPNYFKDTAGNHYKYENGKFVLQKGVSFVGKDGSIRVNSNIGPNIIKSQLLNADGSVRTMRLDTAEGNSYTDKSYVAKNLGLRSTLHANTYYDAKTDTHYVWDTKEHTFKAAKGVEMVAANGMQFDAQGNSITPKGYKMMKNGTIKKSFGANDNVLKAYNSRVSQNNPNAKTYKNISVEYEFYPSGRVKTLIFQFTDQNNNVSRGAIQYNDKAPVNGVRAHAANINFVGLLGIDTDRPDDIK